MPRTMGKRGRRRLFSAPQLIAKFALIYLVAVACMFLSVVAVNLIPNDAIIRELRLSLPTQNYAVLFGSTRTDQWTECIAATIGLGPHVHETGLIERSLVSPTLGNCERSWAFLNNTISEDKTYWRYWHGSQIIMRPALTIMSVLNLRMVTFFLFVSSFMVAFLTLYRHGHELPALALLAGLFCVHLQSALFILPHAADWIIGFLACGFLVARLNERTPLSGNAVSCIFFVAGLLSAFFGLLNNPLVSLTIPLFGLFWTISFQKKGNDAATSFALTTAAAGSWLIGYAASWSAKWLLTWPFVDGVFAEIFDVISYRLGGAFRATEVFRTEGVTLGESFFIVLRENKFAVIIVLVCLLASVLPLMRFIKSLNANRSDVASFIFVWALPFIWFGLLRNHTIMHAWFVSADLYVSFAMTWAMILMSWAATRLRSTRSR